jgi:hypothetical protein
LLICAQSIDLFIFVFFSNFVLAKLAPKGLLFRFAATPPHFPTELRMMRPARPVEVRVLVVLFCTVLAQQEILHKKSTFFSEFDTPLPQFQPFFI